jgi:hypothetical protein
MTILKRQATVLFGPEVETMLDMDLLVFMIL